MDSRNPSSLRRRPAIIIALLAAITLAAGGAPASAGVGLEVAPDGTGLPGIAVDAAGTGHIAFESQTGAAFPFTYDYSYCRLPRGTTTCAPRTRLTTPSNGSPTGRAQVLVDGDRVIVIGGTVASPDNVWAWVSSNGGTSFAAPVRVIRGVSVDEAILGPGSNSVSVISSVTTSGVGFGTGALDGSTSAQSGFNIGAGVGPTFWGADGYSAIGLLNATTPYALLSDSDAVYLRRFDSTKSGYNTAASWLPAAPLDETNPGTPHTAYGPSGAFLAYETNNPRAGLSYPFVVRRIGDDGSIGAGMELGGTGVGAIQGDLQEDASGRVHAAYLDNHKDNRLVYQWSKHGTHWAAPAALTPGADNTVGLQIGVAPDGGGWIVAGSGNHLTPVKVYPLEPKGDADPGLPVPDPGTPPAPPCPLAIDVSSQVKAQVRSGPCFTDLYAKTKKKADKGKYETTGSVRVGGVDLTPSTGVTVSVDTDAHSVATLTKSGKQGKAKVAAGSVVLSEAGASWTTTGNIVIPDLSKFKVKLFGFPIAGDADLQFKGGTGYLTINLNLPYPLSAVRGRTTLRTTMSDGLVIDSVKITATGVPVGPATITNLDVEYQAQVDRFEGQFALKLPPAAGDSLKGAFGMENGAFKHAELEAGPGFPPLPLAIWGAPPVVLNRVGLAASATDGLRFAGGFELLAGKEIGGTKLITIDAMPSSGGGASFYVPKSGAYSEFKFAGKLRLVGTPLASGYASLRTDGPLQFGGAVDFDLSVLNVKVSAKGGLDLSSGTFMAEGNAHVSANLFLATGYVDLTGIISSIGIAGCGGFGGEIPLTGKKVEVELGLSKKWGGPSHLGSCNIGEFRPAVFGGGARAVALAARVGDDAAAGARRQQAGGSFTLGGGDLRAVKVIGSGGRPGFTISGPDGRTLTVEPGSDGAAADERLVAVATGPDSYEVQIKQPAGQWSVTATSGPAIAQVLTAAELPVPKAKGSVRKAGGRARQLRVNVSGLQDQHLIVRELLPGGGAHELGTIRKNGTTTLRFTPADAPAGKRTLDVLRVAADDRQVGMLTIGSYVAPGPQKLAAPRRVTLKRSAKQGSVSVRWTKVAGAASYRIRVTADDGRKQLLTADRKATTLKVPEVTPDDKVKITVTAVDARGREGKSRAATSKAPKVKKKKR